MIIIDLIKVHPRPPGIASGSDTMDVLGFLLVEQLAGPPLETRLGFFMFLSRIIFGENLVTSKLKRI